MKKILVVGGLHGDEPTGIELVEALSDHSKQGITALLGNPEAVRQNKRFIETDLNRSFTSDTSTSLEEKRAVEIKRELGGYDIILDFHNTKAAGTTCAIVVTEPNELHRKLAVHFGFKRIVIMPPSGSLLSQYPETAISLEIAHNDMELYPTEELQEKVKALRSTLLPVEEQLEQYQFVKPLERGVVEKVGITPNDLKNFGELTSHQKKLLNIPEAEHYVPIFAKEVFDPVAFTLLKRIS